MDQAATLGVTENQVQVPPCGAGLGQADTSYGKGRRNRTMATRLLVAGSLLVKGRSSGR